MQLLNQVSTKAYGNATFLADQNFGNTTENYSYLYPARYSTSILLMISVYVLVVLVIYDVKTATKERLVVNHIITISAANVVVSCVSQMLELFVSKYCIAYRWVNAMTLFFGTAIAYTIIWFRQRSFYVDPLLKNAIPTPLRWLSSGIIVGIYVTLICLIPLFVLTYSFEITKYGCVVVWTKLTFAKQAFPLLIGSFVATTFFQLTLLGLVVYPLSLHLTSQGKRVFLTRRTSEESTVGLRDITTVIKRLGLVTLVCVVSSSFTSLLVILSSSGLIHYFWSNFIAADLCINTVAHVLSFINWKERLFPMIGSITKSPTTVSC